MRTIALETSTSAGSIAAFEHDRMVVQKELGKVQRTAQSLAPTLQAMLEALDWEPNSVDLVAVTCGPGSFTGLRAGVTTAKVFAYATGASVVAINTLEAIAANAKVDAERLWAVTDAQRQQLFCACFSVSINGAPQSSKATKIVDHDKWLEQLGDGDAVTGTGLTKLQDRLPEFVSVLPQEQWIPTAEQVGKLGYAKFQRDEFDDLWKLAPQYFRKSAAEEKFDQGLLK